MVGFSHQHASSFMYAGLITCFRAPLWSHTLSFECVHHERLLRKEPQLQKTDATFKKALSSTRCSGAVSAHAAAAAAVEPWSKSPNKTSFTSVYVSGCLLLDISHWQIFDAKLASALLGD